MIHRARSFSLAASLALLLIGTIGIGCGGGDGPGAPGSPPGTGGSGDGGSGGTGGTSTGGSGGGSSSGGVSHGGSTAGDVAGARYSAIAGVVNLHLWYDRSAERRDALASKSHQHGVDAIVSI